jgi:hypothetical protein
MKERVENVPSSSTDPNTCIIAIFANLENSEKKIIKCGKLPKCTKVE